MKLNIGDGGINVPGYTGLDRKRGEEAYPLNLPDNDVDEVRASHILEHFSHTEAQSVLNEWVRVLKPGGWLKIAVPNFQWIAHHYLQGDPINVQGYVMGGHVDGDDKHGCIFDKELLREMMTAAGLVDIQLWQEDEFSDCATLPVSLNLKGKKPEHGIITDAHIAEFAKTIGASMSMPRLSFTDNYFSAFTSLVPLGIRLRKQTGAFWGQCLERSIDEWLSEGVKWVLTLDYDTVFTREDVEALIRLAIAHPEADAIAPIQAHRTKQTPLMTVKGDDGERVTRLEYAAFEKPLMQISTAHFGLTLINADKLREMPRPLFWSKPSESGAWDDGREDEDIYFWRQWEEQGNSLYLANRVAVGHAELMVRWPNGQLSAQYQHPSEFWNDGKPQWCWE